MLDRRLLTFLVLVVAAFALAACGGDDDGDSGDNGAEVAAEDDGAATETTDAESGEPLTVDLFLSSPEGPAWIGLPVAREVGFLEEENLEVNVEATDGSDFVTQQVIAGNADFGMAAATSILIGAQRDKDLRAVFCNTSRNVFGISVPEGSDITDVEGFAGKTLGISEQGGGETPMVEAALLEAGLTPGEDVTLQPIGGSGPTAERAINTGQVDGYASAYTDIIALQAAGVGLVDITPEKYMGIPGDCLVTKEETLNDPEKADQVTRLARAWSKGSLFAASNPDAAREIGCSRFPEDCQDPAFAKQYMDTRVTLLTPVGSELGQTEIAYGEPIAEGWELALELLVSSDQLSGDVDVDSIIGTEQVRSIIDDWSDYDRQAIVDQAEAA